MSFIHLFSLNLYVYFVLRGYYVASSREDKRTTQERKVGTPSSLILHHGWASVIEV